MLLASVAFSIVLLASAGLGTLSNVVAEASEISGSLSSGSSNTSQTNGSLSGGSGSGSLGGTVGSGSEGSNGSGSGSAANNSATPVTTSPSTNAQTSAPIITSGGSTGPALTGRVAVNDVILADGGDLETRPPVGEVLGTSTDETLVDATSPSSWGWWIWALLGLLLLGVLFLIYSYNTRDENTQRLNSRR